MLNQKIKGLYGITPDEDLNINLIENAIKKYNIKILQYRRKVVNIKNKAEEATILLNLCIEYNTLFIVNDDVNLCKKVGAHGIHIGQGDINVRSAREILGDKYIIGVTCHNSLELALEAERSGADYIALGAIFKSKNKSESIHCSLSQVTEIKKNISIPIVGIGGVNLENQYSLYQAGCSSVAMIDGLFKQ
ncbi:thiamine phosphate synthase [Candidatus Thioglobus sp.]|nr:thiamine phosphate synthase [Candidatus Thioglobus sp.]